jgi:alpha-D-xyloside xylohydrolase
LTYLTRFLPLAGLGLLLTPTAYAQQYQTATGLRVSTDSLTVEVQFYSPEIVRVLKQPKNKEVGKKSLVVQAPAPG